MPFPLPLCLLLLGTQTLKFGNLRPFCSITHAGGFINQGIERTRQPGHGSINDIFFYHGHGWTGGLRHCLLPTTWHG